MRGRNKASALYARVAPKTKKILSEVAKEAGISRAALIDVLATMLDGGVIDLSLGGDDVAEYCEEQGEDDNAEERDGENL